jgi:hypothetical protein
MAVERGELRSDSALGAIDEAVGTYNESRLSALHWAAKVLADESTPAVH